MTITSTHERHMQLIDAVNNATTEHAHREADVYLSGWVDGVRFAGEYVDLIRADQEQFSRGIDRPMCCGVFLDWKPANAR